MKDRFSSLRKARHAGFSLIELGAVLAIASIMLTIGVPSFRSLIQSQRITTVTNEFFVAINLTRAEALQRGGRVDLVPKDVAGDWSKGWVVFVDENNNQRPDAGERLIFSHDSVSKGFSIAASLTDSKVQYLAYDGSGRSRTNASGEQTQFGTLTFKLDDQVRKIKLNFLGRPRICNPATDPSTC